MYIDFILDVFRVNQAKDALAWQDRIFSYKWLLDAVQSWTDLLKNEVIPAGAVVSLEADFSPNSISLMLALIEHQCIIVPLTASVEAKKPEFREIAGVEFGIAVDQEDKGRVQKMQAKADQELLLKLKKGKRPGLILFSSGSTGKSKAAVHDFVPILEKFIVPRHSLRSITFLLFDHIGGINTLFYNLANGGFLVALQDRSADTVCAAIERYKVQLLPTSPTFINLLLISEAYKRYNLSSLEMVTYGTEVMPGSTLKRFHELFPKINLLQTYGLSEVGILRSKSKSSDSLWVKIGGEGFETRVVDGTLEIKARSAMLGYLNAPSPFTADGWFKTGDGVEVDGEYFRILGRRSEIINVGGEKVYPAEVESTLHLMEGVEDVAVSAESNPIMGQIVMARVKLNTGENGSEFRKRMHSFCQDKLAKFKIPQKIIIINEAMHGERFKKMRGQQNQ